MIVQFKVVEKEFEIKTLVVVIIYLLIVPFIFIFTYIFSDLQTETLQNILTAFKKL